MDHICYCTNVHAGPTLELARANLERFACRTKALLARPNPLGIGLWLPDQAASEACQGSALDEFAEWLRANELDVFTMNGFPQGNFHQAVVKHQVYMPTWWEESRLEYTRRLVQILARLLPDGGVGSISTLPIAWGSPRPAADLLQKAADRLRRIATELHKLYEQTGKEIVIAIEPEPGCCLGDAGSVRAFFARYLLRGDDREVVRRHITVCHDVCHSAVMWEDQGREIQSYFDLGMRIGKVQVSSAIEMRWDEIEPSLRTEALQQLSEFAEDRYLHQTTIRTGPAGSVRLYEDLPKLIQSISSNGQSPSPEEWSKICQGTWRVHFHVPIFADRIQHLRTTQSEILKCSELLTASDTLAGRFTGHWEVETYAWSVLPKTAVSNDLAAGIAEELRWFGKLR